MNNGVTRDEIREIFLQVAVYGGMLVCDRRRDLADAAVALGARASTSPKEIADKVDTVLASLPSPQASIDVATGSDGVARGTRVRRFVDLSTVGSRTARAITEDLGRRGIAALDSPVSGGVAGAEKGTLAVMVSGRAPTSTRLRLCSRRSAGRSSSATSRAPRRR